jgi:hypothetical protein
MSSLSPACCPLDRPRRKSPPARVAAATPVAHRRAPTRGRPRRCEGAQYFPPERTLVGHPPRPQWSAARCGAPRTVSRAQGWAHDLDTTLALLAALVTLVAAIWWTASAPML